VDGGDQDGRAQIRVYEPARRLVALVKIGGTAEPELDRHEHQSRAMSDRYSEGPEPRLRWSYPRKRPGPSAAKAPPRGRANSFPSVRLKRRATIPFQDSLRDRGRSRRQTSQSQAGVQSDPLKFKPTDSRTNPSSSRHLRAGSDAPDIRRGSSPSSLLPSRGRRSGSHWP
jgi:hypothetical protein